MRGIRRQQSGVGDTCTERTAPGPGYASICQTLLPLSHKLHEDNSAPRTSEAIPNKTGAGCVAWRVRPVTRAGRSGMLGSYKDMAAPGGGHTLRHDALAG